MAGLVGAAVAIAVALWAMTSGVTERLVTRFLPPEAPATATMVLPEEQAALRQIGARLQGRLLWSSNREGNHELYEAEFGSATMRKLTNHPHVDYLGRYSPDGTRIAFLRSRRPWVSFRETDGWDLFVMDESGANTRRVAERAYHPAWTPDGAALTFLRDNRIMRVPVGGGPEEVLHDGRAEPTRGAVGDPEPGAEGRVAFSLRGVSRARRGIWVLDPGRGHMEPVAADSSACHVTWHAGGGLIWVESAGRGGTRLMRAAQPGETPAVLMDLPGRHSHEYFPRPSADGRWLVWGATEEGHEHDRADYEIFLWEIGTPWDTAVRVTHSPANDQWPDLRVP